MSELVCGGCFTMLVHSRSATNIRCPHCGRLNSTRSGNKMGHLSCGQCRTTLAYPPGATTVRCPTCRNINPVRNNKAGGSARPASLVRPRLRPRPRLFAGADPLPNDEASTDVALQIPEDPKPPSEVLNIRGTASAADQTQEEQQRSVHQNQIEETWSLQPERSASADQIHEQRERCYKYSQKALVFGFCAFFAYLTPASSSSAGKMAYKFSMAAFFIAVCADLFSWRTKPRDGRALVYLSSFSLMLMTFLMFISFDSYYVCAIPVVPLIIGAGLVQHMLLLSGGQQQNTNTDDDEFNKLLSDTFDFSALILNCGGFITAFTTSTMPSFSGIKKHSEVSLVGFMLLLTVIVSLYLMLATTVRAQPLTLHVNYLYSLLQLLLLVTVCVFITNKMKG